MEGAFCSARRAWRPYLWRSATRDAQRRGKRRTWSATFPQASPARALAALPAKIAPSQPRALALIDDDEGPIIHSALSASSAAPSLDKQRCSGSTAQLRDEDRLRIWSARTHAHLSISSAHAASANSSGPEERTARAESDAEQQAAGRGAHRTRGASARGRGTALSLAVAHQKADRSTALHDVPPNRYLHPRSLYTPRARLTLLPPSLASDLPRVPPPAPPDPTPAPPHERAERHRPNNGAHRDGPDADEVRVLGEDGRRAAAGDGGLGRRRVGELEDEDLCA